MKYEHALFAINQYIPIIRSINPLWASAAACWWVRRKWSKSMAGKRATDESFSKCGSELNVTDFRMDVFGSFDVDGQLARGITGGNTDNNNNGKPPPMLVVRCGLAAAFSLSSFTIANSCRINRGIDKSDDDVDDGDSSIFSNLPISISSAANSFLYTRFCTSTRYCNSRLSSIINRLVLHSIFNPMLWMTGSFIPPVNA